MNITTLGIDLAKNVFQLHGVDNEGNVVLKKRIRRSKFVEFMQQLPSCAVATESCGSANYWGRHLQAMGHEVKLIAPQFVKPFVMGDKNDSNDARAICQARLCKDMRYVPIKSEGQQDIQSIHRHRELLVKQRTQLANQIRGLLAEYGEIIPKEIRNLRSQLPAVIDDQANGLTSRARTLFSDLYQELRGYDEKIKRYDKEIDTIAEQNPACKNIMSIPGVGAKTATAVYAAIGSGYAFKNGRQFAAWCGLVPRQSSSGDKVRLGGITKRGNMYLRKLLVHGARASFNQASKKDTPVARWACRKQARSSTNRTVVALANKNARVIWVMLTQGVCYEANLVCANGNA